jgi:Ca2+-binding EF-hand superfamily protein
LFAAFVLTNRELGALHDAFAGRANDCSGSIDSNDSIVSIVRVFPTETPKARRSRGKRSRRVVRGVATVFN